MKSLPDQFPQIPPADVLCRIGQQLGWIKRNELLMSERIAFAQLLEPAMQIAARRRQVEGGKQGGKACGKLPSAEVGGALNKVAAVIGLSRNTYVKAQKIVAAAAADSKKFGHLKEEMDRTGKVSTSYAKLLALQSVEEPSKPTKSKLQDLIFKTLQRHQGRCTNAILAHRASNHGCFSSKEVREAIDQLVTSGAVHTRRNLAARFPDVVLGPSQKVLRAGLKASVPAPIVQQIKIKQPSELQTRLGRPQPNPMGVYVTYRGSVRWRLLTIDWKRSDAEIQAALWDRYGLAVNESLIGGRRCHVSPIG